MTRRSDDNYVISARTGFLPLHHTIPQDPPKAGTWEAAAYVRGCHHYTRAFSQERAERKALRGATRMAVKRYKGKESVRRLNLDELPGD